MGTDDGQSRDRGGSRPAGPGESSAGSPGTGPRVHERRPPADSKELLEFLYRLGQAFLACGEQTAQVELSLRRIATAYGARRARVVAFPTAIFISLHDAQGEHVTLAEGPLSSLRLDQMSDVYDLADAAQATTITPREGLTRLTTILKKPVRFGDAGFHIGHVVLAVGIAMVLNPSPVNVGVVAVLAVIVGLMKRAAGERTTYSVPIPVLAATAVSALTFLAVRNGLEVRPLHVLIPPLVTFLPGGMLTFGMIELAYGDMVSGASRLVNGFVQLFLLTFGIAAGALLAGYAPGDLPDFPIDIATSPVLTLAGVLVFAVGVFLHFSAPRRSFGWMLLVILLAFGAQRLGAPLVGTHFSGFFGTLVATPIGYLIRMRFRGPPPMITFLPSFWLLVPGALGLLSVKQMLSDTYEGIEGILSATFIFSSVAIGTLVGASLYKSLTEALGFWQLQIGRAERRKQGPSPPTPIEQRAEAPIEEVVEQIPEI